MKHERHGDYDTGFYKAWAGLKGRCNNPKNAKYPRYGGRGITYDPRWEEYLEFKKDMFQDWQPGLSLDRDKVDDNYCKENCQWITISENSTKDKIKTLAKYNLEGEFIRNFNSAKQAKAVEGIAAQSLSRVTKNGKPYKGYYWKYTESNSNLLSEDLKENNYSARKAKKVFQLDKSTGEIIKEFSSTAEAGRELKIVPAGISNVLKGRAKSAGGFGWKNK